MLVGVCAIKGEFGVSRHIAVASWLTDWEQRPADEEKGAK